MKQYPDDIELVEKLQKGDIEAFDLVYEKYSGKLYAFGLKYLKSKDEAEEMVQSVFLKLWENAYGLRKELSFKSYLFTIAYNDICKQYRRRKYNQLFIEESLLENPQSSTRVEEGIDYQSVLMHVRKIINKLPERQRIIFEKSRFEGKSTKEISEEMGLSPGTIDNYISKSLQFIRSKLPDVNLAITLVISFLFIL